MKPLTVACVWVKGPVPYTADYVVRLERMVRAHLSRPFRFVCLTDQRAALSEHAHIHIKKIGGLLGNVPDNGAGYWNKLRLFDPWVSLTGRVLYLDLDTLVVGSLDPIVDYPSPFALAEDELRHERPERDTDRYHRTVIRRYNSSVMVFDADGLSDLYARWRMTDALRLSTDQDWIAERRPSADMLPMSWFPRISRVQPPWPADAKVVLVKKPKNAVWLEREPWFDAMWGGAA